jgi:hypothetical protein
MTDGIAFFAHHLSCIVPLVHPHYSYRDDGES